MYMHIKEKFGHSSTGPSSNEKPINSYNTVSYMMLIMIWNWNIQIKHCKQSHYSFKIHVGCN